MSARDQAPVIAPPAARHSTPRILIDISRLLHRRLTGRLPTGIDRVSLEYIRHYANDARAVLSLGRFSGVLSPADSARAFSILLDPAVDATAAAWRLILRAFFWNWVSPDVAGCFLFNTGHFGLDNKHHADLLRRRGARPIFLVHDLIPLTHPEYCRRGERDRHVARMRNAIAMGRGIIANSQNTLDELNGFSAAAGLRLPPAVVAPLAPGLPRMAAGPRPMAQPYFVVLGTIEPRKNHILLLHLWRSLVEKLGNDAPRLVIIGQRGWECENVVDLLERCGTLRGYVFERSDCTDEQLVTYLHHAQALLFPSFIEGYGLPLVEALELGVPVIASNLPVFREFAADVPEVHRSARRHGVARSDQRLHRSPQRAAPRAARKAGGLQTPHVGGAFEHGG